MSQDHCFRDSETPCTSKCAAYNNKALNGTNCVLIHTHYSQAQATADLARALSGLISVINVLAASAMKQE